MKNKYILLILVIAAGAYWATLAFNIPVFQGIRFWFWQYEYKPPADWWVIPIIAVISYLSVSIVLKHHHNQKHNIIILIVTGYFLQFGFSFIEGKGFDSLRDRLIFDGHSEFASAAVRIDDISELAANYEELADSNRIGNFPKSKPPGALIFYTLADKAANIFTPNDTPQNKYQRFINFAVFLFPLLSYLVLIPLYGISRHLLPEKYSNLPGMLFVFLPNINLVTMHLDQALYPLLAAVQLWLLAEAIRKNNYLFAALSGFALYISLYITFSLAFMLPFLLITAAVLNFFYNGSKKLRTLTTHITSLLAGFLLTALIMNISTNYDILQRFTKAMQFHAQWKAWEPDARWYIYYAGLNIIEICIWSGITFSIVYFLGLWRSLKNLFIRNIDLISALAVAFSGLVLLQAFLGLTKGETARLWLFLTPMAVIFAANEINIRFKYKPEFSIKLILLLQLITTFLIKVFQDF